MASTDAGLVGAFGTMPGQGFKERLRRTMVTGAAVTIPFIVTLIVLGFVLNFVSNLLDPFVQALNVLGVARGVGDIVAQGMAIVALVALVFVVGVVAENRSGSRLGAAIEALVEGIPGVGSLYASFNRMSEVLLESDAQSFQEVKLVEFPHDGTYALGFLTADAPSAIETAAEEDDMWTLFVPLAPNPVMGGFLVTLPDRRVHEVEISVEEAIQGIVTSGVAMGDVSETRVSREDLQSLAEESPSAPGPLGGVDPDRLATYGQNTSARYARVPDDIAARRPRSGGGESGPSPAEAADRPADQRAETTAPPDEVRNGVRSPAPATPGADRGDEAPADRTVGP